MHKISSQLEAQGKCRSYMKSSGYSFRGPSVTNVAPPLCQRLYPELLETLKIETDGVLRLVGEFEVAPEPPPEEETILAPSMTTGFLPTTMVVVESSVDRFCVCDEWRCDEEE